MRTFRVSIGVACLMAVLLPCGVLGRAGQSGTTSTTTTDNTTDKQQETWNLLKSAYAYTPSATPEVKELAQPLGDGIQVNIFFKGPSGQIVPGLFVRPSAPGIYPCVLLLHDLGSQKETMLKFFGVQLLHQGVAILALDAPLNGARRVVGNDPAAPANYPDVIREGVRDYRVALDYLAARKDINMKQIALEGYGMGSIMGTILAGVDNRVEALALMGGGDPLLPLASQIPEALRPVIYTSSPSLYIGHVSPRPILMLNGSHDLEMSRDAANLLYAAAGQNKSQLWFNSGHLLPQEANTRALAWLIGQLQHMR